MSLPTMDDREVGAYWNENAETWTRLVRAGYDIYRDHLNTPAFFESLPPVAGLRGLDVGCGEGHNTRLLAGRGARMTAIDIAPVFIGHARDHEAASPLGIDYQVASAQALPFADASFAFVTSFMCLMDVPDAGAALRDARRVLAPGGFLQFSIEHPCFNTPHRKKVQDAAGRTVAVEVGGYFAGVQGQIDEWLFKGAPPELRSTLRPFRIPRFMRTISAWINLVTEAGFAVEHLAEPRPSDEAVRALPRLQDAQVVPYFLHVRARAR